MYTLATIHYREIGGTPEDRPRRILKCKGATAPAWVECGGGRLLGYWETRNELFIWACDVLHYAPELCFFEDGFTGEILNSNELEEEEYNLLEEAYNGNF